MEKVLPGREELSAAKATSEKGINLVVIFYFVTHLCGGFSAALFLNISETQSLSQICGIFRA
jgi:hypothetical protein